MISIDIGLKTSIMAKAAITGATIEVTFTQ